MNQKIRVKLSSYDPVLIDMSSEKIIKTVKSTGAIVGGPIPLPNEQTVYTVLRSPHVSKKSREQFSYVQHKRIVDIYSSNTKTIDALIALDLPSGVDVEIKS